MTSLAAYMQHELAGARADLCTQRDRIVALHVATKVRSFVVVGETCSCKFPPSGWLRASALTCRLISLIGVKWP